VSSTKMLLILERYVFAWRNFSWRSELDSHTKTKDLPNHVTLPPLKRVHTS